MLSIVNLTLQDGSGVKKLNPMYIGPLDITNKIHDFTLLLKLPKPMIGRIIHNLFHVIIYIYRTKMTRLNGMKHVLHPFHTLMANNSTKWK